MKQKWVNKNKYLPCTLPKEWPIHSSSHNAIIPWEKLSFSQFVFASCTGVMSNVDLMVQSKEMHDPHYKQCDNSYDRFTINNAIDLNLSESINFFLWINNTVSVVATDTT